MTDDMPIRPFLDFDDDVEIIWPGRFFLSDKNEWCVRTAIQRHSCSTVEPINLSIGYMPLLCLGRCFSKGQLTKMIRRGEPGWFRASKLTDFDRTTTADMDQALLRKLTPIPQGRRSPAKVFRYNWHGMEVYVPTVELIRALFLSRAVMAKAIMRPQALTELCIAGLRSDPFGISLDFTREMPLALLRGRDGAEFIKQFAWIITNREAKASWETVRRMSGQGGAVDFHPPALKHVKFDVLWLRKGRTALVLEIKKILGPKPGLGKIFVLHPDRKTTSRTMTDPEKVAAEKELGELQDDEVPRERTRYILEDGGRAGNRQKSLASVHLSPPIGFSYAKVTLLSDKISERPARPMLEEGADGHARDRRSDNRVVSVERVQASVAEHGDGASLAPLDFRLLPRYEWHDPGQLVPLRTIISWMARVLPHIRIGMQLTIVPDCKKRFAKVGDRPRPVLVAVLQPEGGLPRVLIDVDHSEDFSLSMLIFFYSKDVPLLEIEEDVLGMLDGLVRKNGSWDREALSHRHDVLSCEWMPRVMRNKASLQSNEYVSGWGVEILGRLGLKYH